MNGREINNLAEEKMVKRRYLKVFRKKFFPEGLIILGSIVLSFFLSWLVWRRTPHNFPVIFRKSELGINLLGARNTIWEVPLIGTFFIAVNYFFSRFFLSSGKGLKKLILFVNLGIAVLLLLISIQIYWLNS